MTISPELLQRLMQVNPQQAEAFINQGGQQYTPLWNIQGQGYDGPVSFDRTGYAVGDPYKQGGGGAYEKYDLSGNDTGQSGQWMKDNWNYDNAAIAAALGLTGANLFAASGGMGGFGSSGGDGVASVAGDGAGFDPANPWATGFSDTGTAGGALDTGYAGSGAVTGAGGAAAPALGGGAAAGSGLLSGAGSLLGPAATLIGGALGSQGQKTTETTQKQLPDYLKPYVTAPGGLLDSANTLMHQQMPIVQQQGQQIANMGMGLLSQPMAGNGFAQFMQRPHFGG